MKENLSEADKLYYANLPRKIVGAGAIFFNSIGELLIVKPTYKDGWSIPGGAVELNESPREGCIREVKEEIGLDIYIKKLLVLDYRAKDDDSLQFIFLGGTLDVQQIANIKLQESELSEYKFVSTDDAIANYLRSNLAGRTPACLKAIRTGKCYYLEGSKEI